MEITALSKIISAFRKLTAKNSVTPESLGSILQNTVDLISEQDQKLVRFKDESNALANAASDSAKQALSNAEAAHTQANKAYNEAIAAHEAAVAAFPIARGVAVENNVNTLNDNLDSLAGRHNALADTVATFPKLLPIDGQLTDNDSEPESGVWLVPSPDEGCWYFQSYGDSDWYGHAEEEYNSDLQYIPGLMYLYKNQFATIENDTIKVMGSELVKAIQDADEAKVPGLYVLRNGEPLLVTREASVKTKTWTYTQLMLSDGGIVTRTATTPIPNVSGAVPSDFEWQDWQTLQGGGITTESADNIDNILEPNIYKLDDGSILIVHTMHVSPGPRYVFQNLIDTYDIKTRTKVADEEWGAWESLNSVKKAQAAADNALATANTAKSKADQAHSAALIAQTHAKVALDGVGFLYRDQSDGSLCMVTLKNFLERGIPAEPEGIVICQGGKRLVVNTLFHPSELVESFLRSGVSSATGSNLLSVSDAINDWDGWKHTHAVFLDSDNRNKFVAIGLAYTYLKSNSLPQGRWWLPSLAELLFIYANIEKINFALSLMGQEPLSGECWSSTEISPTLAFYVNLDTGTFGVVPKSEKLGIIGVTHFMNDDAFQQLREDYIKQ